MTNFSDYIVFVDESGDHGVQSIDPQHPVFVLTCCVFKKQHYCRVVLPKLSELKMKYWGNDTVILHEADIRRQKNEEYNILKDTKIRESFMQDLTSFMKEIEFFHVSTVIDKQKIREEDIGKNPYNMSLLFCLEGLYKNLTELNDNSQSAPSQKVDVIIEKRGKREDVELIEEFGKVISGNPSTYEPRIQFENLDFNIVMQDKKANLAGLQIADLIARPIGLSCLRPDQSNQSYDIIKGKSIRNTLKLFPKF